SPTTRPERSYCPMRPNSREARANTAASGRGCPDEARKSEVLDDPLGDLTGRQQCVVGDSPGVSCRCAPVPCGGIVAELGHKADARSERDSIRVLGAARTS